MRNPSFEPLFRPLAVMTALAAVFFLLPTSASAQQGTISGQVVDAASLEGLSGVQVFVPDSDLGTLTDESGRYTISDVEPGTYQLRARLIGYRSATQQVQVEAGETATVNFQLSVSAVSLQEVVVTATGQRQRRELGNAVSTIDASETVANQNPQTLSTLLQGNSTGVTIQQSSGSIGAASTLKIRGNSSLGLSQTPIVYVDGARVNNNNNVADAVGIDVGGQATSRLDDLNPEDIESIEIIKGPAAATLYGTEASAGVIRITTKQGSAGAPTRYTLSSTQGTNYDVTSWWSMAFNPDFFFGIGKDTVYVQSLMEGTRFGDPFRHGHLQSYSGTVRGGAETVSYFGSGRVRLDEGNMPQNTVDSYSARGNFNIDPSDEVDISLSTNYISRFTELPENDNNLFGISSVALGSPWWGPITRSDPNTGGAPIETCMLAFEAAREFGVPLADVTNGSALGGGFACDEEKPFFGRNTFEEIFTQFNQEQVERFIGSASFQWRPVEYVTNSVSVGYDESSTVFTEIIPVDPTRPFGSLSEGTIEKASMLSRNITLEANSRLDVALTEDIRSQTTVGFQFADDVSEWQEVVGRNFPAGSPAVNNSVENEGNDFFVETKTAGAFIQEQLSWKDRLFLTPGVRFDDNSAFGENLGIQEYYQVNGSYVLSDEDWFPRFFDQARVRVAWGQSGKQPGSNDALFLLETTPVSRQNTNVPGVTADQPGNPDLRPETGDEWEAGFEASFLESRVSLDFTYYNQTINDAIIQRPLAPSTGFPDERFVNISELQNKGVEVSLNAGAVDREDFRWDWRVNFTSNDSEITELPEQIVITEVQRHREGFAPGAYFDPVVRIENGEAVVSDEPEFLGEASPKWEGSVSTTLSFFDRITAFAQLDYQGGHHLFNGTEDLNCALFTCISLFEKNEAGELTDRAEIVTVARRVGSQAPFVSESDFAKLRTVSLRFDIPEDWVSFLGVRDMSLNATGENLMTWTAYRGIDPEVNVFGSDDIAREQFIGLPVGRRYTTSLQVTF